MKPLLVLTTSFVFVMICFTTEAQNSWQQKTDFAGAGRYAATGFTIGEYGYVGAGYDGSFFKDFWKFDPTANSWTSISEFGGAPRAKAISFSIGTKGYVGLGHLGMNFYGDFWEYDTQTDTWTQKANFPPGPRSYAVAFSIGDKGYVCTGWFTDTLYKDLWEYDPTTDTWTQKSDLPASARYAATGFAIGDKGYIGAGNFSGNLFEDFWEYDPSQDTWTQKANFIGLPSEKHVGFSINNKGYFCTGIISGAIGSGGGSTSALWEFDPSTNNWTNKIELPGPVRYHAVAIAINNKAYVCTGTNGSAKYSDLWEYTEAAAQLNSPDKTHNLIFPTYTNSILYFKFGIPGDGNVFKVFSSDGKNVLSVVADQNSTLDVSTLAPGIYTVQIVSTNQVVWERFVKQ